MNYDVYFYFIDPSGNIYPMVGGSGTGFGASAAHLYDSNGNGVPDALANTAALTALANSSLYRFITATTQTSTAYKTTILGDAIEFSSGVLDQGMWTVVAFMVNNSITGDAALQNPQNWDAWTVKPFILGTPFKSANGTTVGAVASATGTGKCF